MPVDWPEQWHDRSIVNLDPYYSNATGSQPAPLSPSAVPNLQELGGWDINHANARFISIMHKSVARKFALLSASKVDSTSGNTRFAKFGILLNASGTGETQVPDDGDHVLALLSTNANHVRELAIRPDGGGSSDVYHVHLGNIVW